MFKFLWKTKTSLSFRQEVEPYIINTNYEELWEEPQYCNYKEFGVVNSVIISNQKEIDIQEQYMQTLTLEELEAVEKIQPIFVDYKPFTEFFSSISDYDWEEFQTACQNYLSSL